MKGKAFRAALAATVFVSAAGIAHAQTAPQDQDAKIADLQRQVDELKAMVQAMHCLLYTSPSPRDKRQSRMPSSA